MLARVLDAKWNACGSGAGLGIQLGLQSKSSDVVLRCFSPSSRALHKAGHLNGCSTTAMGSLVFALIAVSLRLGLKLQTTQVDSSTILESSLAKLVPCAKNGL